MRRAGATELTGAKVTSAAVVPEKAAMPNAPLGTDTVRVMPAFCRVKVTDRPSADSDIKIEVWLPLAGFDPAMAKYVKGDPKDAKSFVCEGGAR
jgi:feruloyl esterase